MAKEYGKKEYPDMDDITDSVLIMNAKPRKTALFLIYIILGVVLAFFVWASFAHKDDYVRVSGQIRPTNEDAVISSPLNGTISGLKVKNGDIVKKGQTLMILDTSALKKQAALMNKEIDTTNTKLKNYELLKESIRENTNKFSKNGEDADFYTMFEKYQNDLKNAQQQSTNSNVNVDQNKQNAADNIKENTAKESDINEQINLYQTYKSSVNDNQDEFSDAQKSSSIYATYKVYKDNYDSLQKKLQGNPETAGAIQAQLDNLKLKEKASIDSSLASLNSSLKGAQFAIASSQKNLDLFNQVAPEESVAEQSVMLTTLNQITSSTEALNQSLLEYQLKLVDINTSIDNSTIKANKTGKVMLQNNLKVGTNIVAGNELIRIVSENSNLKFELTVPDRDISSFKVGKKVKFEISSLPYAEYGDASGKITEISPDAITDQKTNLSYYLVECSLNQARLTKKDGDSANLIAGMQGQGIVINKPKTVLTWILEELNMWTED